MKFQLRFGMHRDAEVLHKTKDLYDGLVIPAHILAHQSTSTAVFVTSLPNHEYVIDPMTYLFLHPAESFRNDNGELRPSLEKLCNAYHPKLAGILEGLEDDEKLNVLPKLDEFCAGIIEFQRSTIADASAGSKAEKYLRRKGYQGTRPTDPRCLVAPYFKFENVDSKWYKASVDCLVHARAALKDGERLAAIVHCGVSALSDASIMKVANDFKEADMIFLWLEDFNQHSVESDEIITARTAIQSLARCVCFPRSHARVGLSS